MSDELIPEVSHPTEACPNPRDWSCFDGEGTEVEVVEFLRSLVFMLKPQTLIETGCYRGYGTEQIALGVQDNGFGEFHSCDIGLDMVQITAARLNKANLDTRVRLHIGTGLQLIAEMSEIDFAFLDSGPDGVRTDELRALLPKLSRSGVVVIHDTGIQHGLREHFLQAVKELKLQFIMFDTPRGLSIVRKPWTK